MQYILTEVEYAELKLRHEGRTRTATARLQEICTLAAQHIPVPCDWSQDKQPRPWGCILAKPRSSGYCDDCPVSDVCPNPRKEWSK